MNLVMDEFSGTVPTISVISSKHVHGNVQAASL